jgi:hypothetical protein
VRDPQSSSLVFIGPAGQEVRFDPAIGGRHDLAAAQVPADVMSERIKGITGIGTLASPPALHVVKDLLGHERRIWSARGTTSGGKEVQVEVMVWYCDVRNMTFIGAYATSGTHPLQHAVDILLPAVCHQPK